MELAWIEIDKHGNLNQKRREFKTQKTLEKFIEKLQDSGNLYQILGCR